MSGERDDEIATLTAQLREAEARADRMKAALDAALEMARLVAEQHTEALSFWSSAAKRNGDMAEKAERELAEECARTDALVAALPKCTVEGCGAIATKAHARGGPRFCDAHGSGNGWPVVDDYPRSAALRAILASRAK